MEITDNDSPNCVLEKELVVNFDELLMKATNVAYTENGAVSNASTLSECLNLFSIGGASRTLSDLDRTLLIKAAYAENPELAIRVIFYLGDIRTGQGERDLFKLALKVLADVNPDALSKLVGFIPMFTRWDYIYTLVGTSAEASVKKLLINEFTRTQATGEKSLMYKWLKSTNTSSKESVRLGKWTAKVLGYPTTYQGIKDYQHTLKRERAKLGDAVVEHKISRNMWEDVDYSKVPSKASLNYKNAFKKHDEDRYAEFIKDVLSGKTKINSSVLYPHDIVNKYYDANLGFSIKSTIPELEAMWKSLPNYVNSDSKVITVVDTSGSMDSAIGFKSSVSSRDVAYALGAYTAQRLTGPFAGKVISFSSEAHYFNLLKYGNTLGSMLQVFDKNSIVDTTNIQSVFDLILGTALSNNVPQSDLPTKVIIISDMEFDQATSSRYDNSTNLDVIRQKYNNAGYVMPELVFWNVNARTEQYPAVKDSHGVAMVSGYSPVLLEQVLSGKIDSPVEVMLKTVMTDRYTVLIDSIKDLLK